MRMCRLAFRSRGASVVKVVVADDHPIVIEGLTSLLGAMEGVDLVGTAANGLDAVALVERCRPDVVIMDLRMPGIDGVGATSRILDRTPQCAVLVLTMYDDDELLACALKAGARGFLLKGAGRADIETAIHSVSSGGAVFGSGVADQVLARLTLRPGVDPFPELSSREKEVLELLAQGCGNQQLARRLFISPKTVRNHVANILSKLGLPDRSQAIVAAREAGFGAVSDAGRAERARLGSRPDPGRIGTPAHG